MTKTYTLPSEADATSAVSTMAGLIRTNGYITVGDWHDLLGFSKTYQDEQLCWHQSTHRLFVLDEGGVSLQFPDPVPIPAKARPMDSTIRIVFEIERKDEEHERQIINLINATPLISMAKSWSFSRRPTGGPRVSYRSPVSFSDDV